MSERRTRFGKLHNISQSPVSTPPPPPPSTSSPTPTPTPTPQITPDLTNPYVYRIGRGETGVLTVEPYKSALLPLWRFRTPALAARSAADLWARFLEYEACDDFVGMDMARKFVQMGMTRAARYANYKGGRKYVKGGGQEGGEGGEGEGKRQVLARSEGHKGKEEKEEASANFREVWERCRAYEGYQVKKGEFLKGQKEWERGRKRGEAEG